ncbi:MAG: RluA family pseudouridine synthase [Deltaproteobacteria bacterium]|jgi:23S rRNA pseudouridine1911/1915/1917 synthase|nr:RluA family pseudouridine synthase [Deltaproteobacteria bacterium]MBW2535961.1 RluA family pseudouridine synthase [Deltaproteobacteria bacterium]
MERQADEALEFVVGADDPRRRLDLLAVHLLRGGRNETTRAEIHRWIELGRVLVDGVPGRRAQPVRAGATVTIRPAPALTSAATPDPSIRLDLVYEDDHLLVVDKPAGMVVHPARGHRSGTLVHGLLAHLARDRQSPSASLPEDPRDPEGHLRPGIVHRLDKDTSGLLVVAKTPRVREALKARFASHDIERTYTAIVSGQAAAARYDTLHGRHPRSRKRFTSNLPAEHRGARRAITVVEPLERIGAATLVRCRLETGRTHQIRVHLAEQGKTPILGDPLYGPRPTDPVLRAIGEALARQALHATTLGFVHPVTERAVRWESPLPVDMTGALQRLRAATRAST